MGIRFKTITKITEADIDEPEKIESNEELSLSVRIYDRGWVHTGVQSLAEIKST